MSRNDLEITGIPREFWDTKLADVRGSKQLPYDDPATFFKWLTKPVALLTILGEPMSGKTTLAGAITRYWIEDTLSDPSLYEFDEFHIFWTNAPQIMPVYQHSLMFQDEASYDAIMQKTKFLVLDDLDSIDERSIAAATALICSRTSEKLLTIITAKSTKTLARFDTSVAMRIAQGRKVVVNVD